jgi:23S rRNA pseudouridine2605 synthase
MFTKNNSMSTKRLNKFLQEAGIAARRKADELIFAGYVSVNGQPAQTPALQVDPLQDIVAVKGKKIAARPPRLYFMVNKPRGALSTNAPVKKGERRVIDLFSPLKIPHLFTIGRLDKESEGLLLVTNDGDFAQQVAHPSFEIEKEYIVKVDDEITSQHLIALSDGINIDGDLVKPKKVSKVRRGTFKITLGEGKKREIRKMCENLGLAVLELKRIRIGPLTLGNLLSGAFRKLSESEVKSLWKP